MAEDKKTLRSSTSDTPDFATKIKELEAELAAANARFDALEGVILSLQEAIAPKNPDPISAPVLSGETWTHGGKKYRMLFPSFVLNDRTITEQEVLSDPELRKQIVQEGIGVFEEISA